MYVKDHMTQNPVTVTPDESISKVVDIMQKGHFHRVPVVDNNGKLVGLVTEGVVTEASGQNTTSLSIFELNYLLLRTKVNDIMIKDVVTIDQESFVEQAAERMIDNNINVLPVVDDDNKVIGIITEKDIFQTFVELLGLKHQGTKFVIGMEDVPGVLVKTAQLFEENNANIVAFGEYHTERGVEVFIKATGEIAVEEMTRILKNHDVVVLRVIQTTTDGETITFDPESIH